jgi:hypothetical protein
MLETLHHIFEYVIMVCTFLKVMLCEMKQYYNNRRGRRKGNPNWILYVVSVIRYYGARLDVILFRPLIKYDPHDTDFHGTQTPQ